MRSSIKALFKIGKFFTICFFIINSSNDIIKRLTVVVLFSYVLFKVTHCALFSLPLCHTFLFKIRRIAFQSIFNISYGVRKRQCLSIMRTNLAFRAFTIHVTTSIAIRKVCHEMIFTVRSDVSTNYLVFVLTIARCSFIYIKVIMQDRLTIFTKDRLTLFIKVRSFFRYKHIFTS